MIKYRNGLVVGPVENTSRRWKWGHPFPADFAFDIVAFQTVGDAA